MVEAGARRRGGSAEDTLLATFDIFNDVFGRADGGSRDFTDLLAAPAVVVDFDSVITTLADEAKLDDVASLVASWRILAHGSARSFVDGDRQAGTNARHMAHDLVVRHRAQQQAFAVDVDLDSVNQQTFDDVGWG